MLSGKFEDDHAFQEAVGFLDAGDISSLRERFRANPNLVQRRVSYEGYRYFETPALLEFVAENPVRTGHLPLNVIEIARLMRAPRTIAKLS